VADETRVSGRGVRGWLGELDRMTRRVRTRSFNVCAAHKDHAAAAAPALMRSSDFFMSCAAGAVLVWG